MLLYFISIACSPMDKPGVPLKAVEMRSDLTEKTVEVEKTTPQAPPEVVEEEFQSKEEVLVSTEDSPPVEPETEVLAEVTPKVDTTIE